MHQVKSKTTNLSIYRPAPTKENTSLRFSAVYLRCSQIPGREGDK